jgi:hypothetical protein
MWKRRDVIGLLGAGAASMTLAPTRTEAALSDPAPEDDKHATLMKLCQEACAACANACNKAFHHCLAEATRGKPKHVENAQVILDCAAVCELSACLLSRESSLMVESCRACAGACRRCALVCKPFDDELLMTICTSECNRCEESCRSMLEAMGSKSPA